MTFNYLGTNSFIGTFQGSVHSELSGTGNITNTTRLARDNYTLPADVIFYAPLNDPIGHPVTQALLLVLWRDQQKQVCLLMFGTMEEQIKMVHL